MTSLAKTYSPREFEEKHYARWERGGYFKPSGDPTKPTFTIVIPPPNITGQLHMGHALDNTLQDILVRYKRMRGFDTLWVPGTDHASIATEAKIVEAMREEGLSKEQIGREAFLSRAWDWREKYGSRIITQLKKMGSSCDWDRERFTLDERCSDAVKEVFVRLYRKGLIYRGERIINWCPHCKTTISNAEVEHIEQKSHFWHIRYPLVGGGGNVEIATTRPETLLGDTAVAVNPSDPRYAHLIGSYVTLPLVGRRIPIVGDEHAQTDKGTGAVKITPAHDPNDFEVGRRQHLPMEVMLTPDAKITSNYPRYAGMDRYEAREAIVADLEREGYLVGIEDLTHEVGSCYRCGTTIEPMVSLQWFVRMEPLAAPAVEAVRRGEVKFVPERFTKNYLHWMENTQDWCISRQLWWGHRIPAYYCESCGEVTVSKEPPPACPRCGGRVHQDEDTLDTWFSSALWPFSVLGWPEDTADYRRYYPTNTLVTGYDIITFWVSRMIFSGIAYTGKVPFDTVLIHGLVRDAQGRKMSKSLGNGIDPLEIIDKYGADALRFALATGNSPGADMRFSDERIEAARNFANKLWNAARFVLLNLSIESITLPSPSEMELEDRWILSGVNRLAREVCDNLDRYEIGVALGKIYDFVWDVFCDWYIELVKPRFADKGSATNRVAQNVIAAVLDRILKLLHPFLPFITEEIWQSMPHFGKKKPAEDEDAANSSLPKEGEAGAAPSSGAEEEDDFCEPESIMIAAYPQYDPALDFPRDEEKMRALIEVIRAVRALRQERGVPVTRKAALHIVSGDGDIFNERATPIFARLAGASSVEYTSSYEGASSALQAVTARATVYIPLSDLVDLSQERARLAREREKIAADIARTEARLANASFTEKAPARVIDAEREKLSRAKETLRGIEEALRKVGGE